MEIENDRHWRISKSGFSIKVGWAGSERIVCSYPKPLEVPLNAARFKQWMEDAEMICSLHNTRKGDTDEK